SFFVALFFVINKAPRNRGRAPSVAFLILLRAKNLFHLAHEKPCNLLPDACGCWTPIVCGPCRPGQTNFLRYVLHLCRRLSYDRPRTRRHPPPEGARPEKQPS